VNETQSDKAIGHWTGAHQSDEVLGHWSRPADDVDDADQWMERDWSRQRHAQPDARHLAAGAGDSYPAESKLSRQQTGHVEHHVTQTGHPRAALSSVPRALPDYSDTVSEPAATESVRYRRHFSDSVEEDALLSHAKSDITDVHHTRRSTALTKIDRRADSTTHPRQQRRNKAPRLTEQHAADLMSHDEPDSRQDVGRRRNTATTSERWTDDRHDQRRQQVIHQQDKVPRRLVFRYVSICSTFTCRRSLLCLAAVLRSTDCRMWPRPLSPQYKRLFYSFRCLISAYTMRVNPNDPDAFSSLSASDSHAEQLNDQRDICDPGLVKT